MIEKTVLSAKEFKKIRSLTACAMLLAIQVLLNYAGSISIGQSIRISFGYISNAITGMLFGPIPAMLSGILSDLLGTVLKPIGPYYPGFTISAGLVGLTYGFALYREELTWLRVFLCQLFIAVFLHLLLNTLWLSDLYGNAFFVILPGRITKNGLQLLADAILLLPILKWVYAQRDGALRFLR